VYLEDCTGCELFVQACPVTAPGEPGRKAINLAPREPLLAAERENIAFLETLPVAERPRVDFGTVRGTQFLQPLFEFSGACAGCGETPYLKLISQLFGDRLLVANATGCSSIYGGNLPTTPWTAGPDGRGPAWSNSLFEGNAEFGLGFRLGADRHAELARRRLAEQRDEVGADLADEILSAPQLRESELGAQRDRVDELKRRLAGLDGALADPVADLLSVADHLVLDTEVYSNTGGQSSKATPLGAVAKFASSGKTLPKKDLALQAIAYGYVYVARVAMGADPQETLRAFREAEAYDGPSLVIAYSHCIAHGIEMRDGLDQQYRAVASGYWPLIRYDPVLREAGANPFLLDSPRPRIPLASYTQRELRYRALANTHPAEAERLAALAQEAVDQRWDTYEEMARRGPAHFPADARPARPASPPTPADTGRHAGGPLMDTSTRYMGLKLRNPLIASASPLSNTANGVRALADGGVGAVVLFSLFEEQLRREAVQNAALADAGTASFAESLSYFRPDAGADPGPRRYLSLLERAVAAVDIPVIASLNGSTAGGWTDYAIALERAGAAAIELNIYHLPGDPLFPGRDVETRHVEILTTVKAVVRVPVAVKMSPYYSSTGEMALRLDRAGADGLVLFNRFLQPDVDPETLSVTARSGCPARPRPGCPGPGSRCWPGGCAPHWPRRRASRRPPTWPATFSAARTW
jgi:pyruvate/2-oxoacid:ferredoxin oxidoreductase beta subunit/dihydroorotate dehydrogenase